MELKQTQQQELKMAPMLFEAISLLQYNQLDLNAYIKEKALENPLLEYQEAEAPPVRMLKSSGSVLSTTDVIENTLTETISFREDLKHQVRIFPLSEVNAKLVFELIDNLDEKGYWLEDEDEWAIEMGYPLEEVEASLEILRSLEPAGVGARNLQDCLFLQVERVNDPNQELIKCLISDYLELLAKEDWDTLSNELGVDTSLLKEAYATIKTLSPYPVNDRASEPTIYVAPDLLLEESDGRFYLKLVQGTLPKLTINKEYYNELLLATKETKQRSYVHKKFAEADWLLKGLAKREETLIKIAEALTDYHAQSFSKPPEKWHPLTLKEVAEEIGVHESTISRAIKDKYVKTPYGLLEMKRFFPKGIKQFGGRGFSALEIKGLIRQQVALEDPQSPLSDQALADWFRMEQGLVLSRRVVAKYRTEMGIASSMKRRKA